VEGVLVRLGCILAERVGEAVAHVRERLGRRLDRVDEVAVCLFAVLPVSLLVEPVLLTAVLEQIRLVLDEEVELARDHVAERVAAKPHTIASSGVMCAGAAASQVSSSRARRAPARACSSAAGSERSSWTASARAATSPAATTRPAPKRRTGSAMPPT